jgi:hypothetical protein
MIDILTDVLGDSYEVSGWFVAMVLVLGGALGAAAVIVRAENAGRHHGGHEATAESNAARRRSRIEQVGRRALQPRPDRPHYGGTTPARKAGPPRDLSWAWTEPPLPYLPRWQPQLAYRID